MDKMKRLFWGAMLLLLPCVTQAKPTGSPASLRHVIEGVALLYTTLTGDSLEEYDCFDDDDSLGFIDEGNAVDPMVAYYAEMIGGGIQNEDANYITPARLLFRESEDGNNNNNNNEADEEDLFIGADQAEAVLGALQYLLEGGSYTFTEDEVQRLTTLHANCKAVIAAQVTLLSGEGSMGTEGRDIGNISGVKRTYAEAHNDSINDDEPDPVDWRWVPGGSIDSAPPNKRQNRGLSNQGNGGNVAGTHDNVQRDEPESSGILKKMRSKGRSAGKRLVKRGGALPSDEVLRGRFLKRHIGKEHYVDAYVNAYKEGFQSSGGSERSPEEQAIGKGKSAGSNRGYEKKKPPSDCEIIECFIRRNPGLADCADAFLNAYKDAWSSTYQGEKTLEETVKSAAKRNAWNLVFRGVKVIDIEKVRERFIEGHPEWSDYLDVYTSAYMDTFEASLHFKKLQQEKAKALGRSAGSFFANLGANLAEDVYLRGFFLRDFPKLKDYVDLYIEAFKQGYQEKIDVIILPE